jgi:glutamate dehydrogenase
MTSTDLAAGARLATPAASPRGETGDDRAAQAARDEVIARAEQAAPEAAALIELYYRYVPPEEIAGDEPRDLAGRVASHRRLAESRVPGQSLVRLCNPTIADDGWTAAATVCQVVTDDMPYLVDSVVPELHRLGVGVLRLAHPIVVVRRGTDGSLAEVLTGADPAEPPEGAVAESWMYLETVQITDPERAGEIETRVQSVLGDVREVIEDTSTMVQSARSLAAELRARPTPAAGTDATEAAGLLDWLADGHFTFLGYRRYELVTGEAGRPAGLRAELSSGLGVLRSDSLAARSLMAGPDSSALAPDPQRLVLTRASAPSTVHRSALPYYVGVKTFDRDGNVDAEHRFLGLLTTTARHENVLEIPVLARRVREVIHRAGFPLESYSGELMLEVAQTYPRAELFSTNSETLYEVTTGVLALAGRRKVKLFLRPDPYGRFFSCLVYLPRDRYTTGSRQAMQNVLLTELCGTGLEYAVRVGETEFAQVHFVVYTDTSQRESAEAPEPARIQARLEEAARSWDETIADYLARDEEHDGAAPRIAGSASEAQARVAAAFPEAYKEDFTAADGLADLHTLESLAGEETEAGLDLSFYVPQGAEPGERRFKLYLVGERVTLSAVLPVLQRMGVVVLDERPYAITLADGTGAWIFDFGLRIEQGSLEGLAEDQEDDLRVRFAAAFAAAWRGDTEVDGFNALVLGAGLSWRQAAVLRAYAKYLRQAGTNFSQDYIEDALLAHTDVARALIRLFEATFDPATSAEQRTQATESLATEAQAMIDEVTSLDSDRILRGFLTMIGATLRTNYWVRGGAEALRPFVAVKLDPNGSPICPSRDRSSRSSCTRRVSRPCTCGSGQWPAAGCAGRTVGRISAPRYSGWSRPRPSRTR